jgi:integrase/recombinase XerD
MVRANISNPHTRRAYENAVKDFMRFAGIRRPEEFRTVTRAHLIAWRDELRRRELGGATIRHRLASLGLAVRISLREKRRYPQPGQRRRAAEDRKRRRQDAGDRRPPSGQIARSSPGGHHQEQAGPAILSTLLFLALRREELCKLKVKDFRHARKGVPHLKVSGKGGKTRYLPLHPGHKRTDQRLPRRRRTRPR